jgi:hypothetical protein
VEGSSLRGLTVGAVGAATTSVHTHLFLFAVSVRVRQRPKFQPRFSEGVHRSGWCCDIKRSWSLSVLLVDIGEPYRLIWASRRTGSLGWQRSPTLARLRKPRPGILSSPSSPAPDARGHQLWTPSWSAASSGAHAAWRALWIRHRHLAVCSDGTEIGYDLFLGVPEHRAPVVDVGAGLTADG